MPQMASGENWLSPRETAPISLPLMYTGLPLMPLATLVRAALPPILPRMMSCLGPHIFLAIPTISTGTGSGSVPWNTVQAVPFMPCLTSARGMISTLPDFGRTGGVSAADVGSAVAARLIRIAAVRIFMGRQLQLPHCTMRPKWDRPPGASWPWPSSTALFEAEWTYAYSSCPAHSPSRPSTDLLSTQWKQRSQAARDPQQSYGIAARKADSHLGLVGARRESLGHAAWNQPVYRRR